MKSIIISICVFALASCSLPQSSNELVASTEIKRTYYYPQDFQMVSSKVKAFLEQCYQTRTILVPMAGIPVPLTSTYQVVEENIGNSKRYSARSSKGFGISIDIKPNGENGKTQVDMYALRSNLRDKFTRIDDAVNDKDPGCGVI